MRESAEKLDIVMTQYREAEMWPYVCRGLLANKERINRVWVTYDGDWEYTLDPPDGIQVEFLSQEKRGYGVSRAINLGASKAETDYFVILQGDFMLAPHSLSKNAPLLDEHTILGGPFQDAFIQPDGQLEVVGEDPRLSTQFPGPGTWKSCRGGYLLVNTHSFLSIGGYDEGYEGYGFEDYDLAVRWFHKFGDDGIALGPGNAYHVRLHSRAEREASQASLRRFLDCLTAYDAAYKLAPPVGHSTYGRIYLSRELNA